MSKKKRTLSVIIALIIFTMQLLEVFALDTTKDTANVLPSGISNRDIGSYIDKYIQTYDKYTTGVALAVINNDETIYKKYYGNQDLENKVKVDENSVFEWGSISKLFVWISVMQLAERGMIDLNTDIRRYLPKGFFSKLNYQKPITILNLMNHNAGWQETSAEAIMEEDGTKPQDLIALLKKTEPVQVFKPGEVCAYSNWGVSLAAGIVERVSGQKYYAYVHKNILKPLAMEHTALLNDLSDNKWVQAQRQLDKGYFYALDENGNLKYDQNGAPIFELRPHYQIPLYPCGMVTSTLDDLITFAKLFTKGNCQKSKIFQKANTMTKLLSPTACYGNTDVARICHGLWTLECKDQLMGHYGNSFINSSGLIFDPKTGTAYVVMTNQYGELVYNYLMLNLMFGSTADRGNNSTEGFIDAKILSNKYVATRSIFDTDEYVDKSTINIKVIDSNNFILGGLQYTQYAPGMFNSAANMPLYVSIKDDGTAVLDSYTLDYIDYNVFKKMISGVNFTGTKIQDNFMKPWYMLNDKKMKNCYKNFFDRFNKNNILKK